MEICASIYLWQYKNPAVQMCAYRNCQNILRTKFAIIQFWLHHNNQSSGAMLCCMYSQYSYTNT